MGKLEQPNSQTPMKIAENFRLPQNENWDFSIVSVYSHQAKARVKAKKTKEYTANINEIFRLEKMF